MSFEGSSFLSIVAAAAPAGGAELSQVAIATAGALVLTAVLLTVAVGHRTGKLAVVGRFAGWTERISGLPGWAAIPIGLVGGALLLAVFGMYWDISLHIDEGRDAGPLANPAHYAILLGLFGVFAAAVLAMALPLKRPGKAALQLAPGWWVPLGGVLMFACAGFALTGFPLDDIWHRIFGQDVTLWGPTHLMLIGGASLATLSMLVLMAETTTLRAAQQMSRIQRIRFSSQTWGLLGALLIAMSTFQAEFDFGVPQFRLLFHPILLALAAGVALVAARVHFGRGGALVAALFFILVRGGLAVVVGPVLGQTTPHFPLYLAEAAVVELVALRIARDRPLLLGAVAGFGIGTIGTAAEWGWSHVWMPIAWPTTMMPEAFLVSIIVGVAAGALGGWVGAAITPSLVPKTVPSGRVALGSLLVCAAVVAFALPTTAAQDVRASVTTTQLAQDPSDPGAQVALRIRVDPPSAVEDAEWFTSTSWQGGGSVIDSLKEISPGLWETTRPIPAHGEWKTQLRFQKGNAINGLPIHLPADDAIPVAGVATPAAFERAFIGDKKLMQREQKEGVAGWLQLVGYLTVLGITVLILAALGWGLRRASITLGAGPRGGGPTDDAATDGRKVETEAAGLPPRPRVTTA